MEPAVLQEYQLLARSLWNRMGGRAGGVDVGIMSALWAEVQTLNLPLVQALQARCNACDKAALLSELVACPVFAKVYAQCLDICAKRLAVSALERNGTPAFYEDAVLPSESTLSTTVKSSAASAAGTLAPAAREISSSTDADQNSNGAATGGSATPSSDDDDESAGDEGVTPESGPADSDIDADELAIALAAVEGLELL